MTEAAGVTFYTPLALFPAIASFISMCALFADPVLLCDQLQTRVALSPAAVSISSMRKSHPPPVVDRRRRA
jgi:uncharacterized BrkB/YihY/UPF0761 family membrane protein